MTDKNILEDVITVSDVSLTNRVETAMKYLNTNPDSDSERRAALEILWLAAVRFNEIVRDVAAISETAIDKTIRTDITTQPIQQIDLEALKVDAGNWLVDELKFNNPEDPKQKLAALVTGLFLDYLNQRRLIGQHPDLKKVEEFLSDINACASDAGNSEGKTGAGWIAAKARELSEEALTILRGMRGEQP